LVSETEAKGDPPKKTEEISTTLAKPMKIGGRIGKKKSSKEAIFGIITNDYN
jgi:hypothetical protein